MHVLPIFPFLLNHWQFFKGEQTLLHRQELLFHAVSADLSLICNTPRPLPFFFSSRRRSEERIALCCGGATSFFDRDLSLLIGTKDPLGGAKRRVRSRFFFFRSRFFPSSAAAAARLFRGRYDPLRKILALLPCRHPPPSSRAGLSLAREHRRPFRCDQSDEFPPGFCVEPSSSPGPSYLPQFLFLACPSLLDGPASRLVMPFASFSASQTPPFSLWFSSLFFSRKQPLLSFNSHLFRRFFFFLGLVFFGYSRAISPTLRPCLFFSRSGGGTFLFFSDTSCAIPLFFFEPPQDIFLPFVFPPRPWSDHGPFSMNVPFGGFSRRVFRKWSASFLPRSG